MKNGFDNRERIVVHIEEDLEELIPGFLEHRREDVLSITRALDAGDFENIMIIGHSMKGAGGGYGFDRITELGRYIEDAAKGTDKEKIMQSNLELADYLDRIVIKYDSQNEQA